MYCGDETGAFVGDCGLSTCRFGYGGEDCPKLVLSSYSSTRSLKALDSETKQQQEQTLGKERQQNDITSIFTQPSSLSSSMLSSLNNPSEETHLFESNGMISSFPAWEKAWETAFKTLNVRNNGSQTPHPILCVDDSLLYWNSKSLSSESSSTPSPYLSPAHRQREKILEILFEKEDAKAVFLAPSPMLQAFSMGRQTGVVVDMGAGGCRSTPVVDGMVCKHAMKRNGRGGNWLSEMQLKILDSCAKIPQQNLQPRYNTIKNLQKIYGGTKEKGGSGESQQLENMKNCSLHHRLAVLNMMYEMKTSEHVNISLPEEGTSHSKKSKSSNSHSRKKQKPSVSGSNDNESSSFSSSAVMDIDDTASASSQQSEIEEQYYVLPDGTNIDLNQCEGGDVLCELPELLFCEDPLMYSGLSSSKLSEENTNIYSSNIASSLSLPKLVHSSISNMDVDIRKELCGNILLCGAHSQFSKLDQRLSLEMSNLTSSSFKCRVIAPRNSVERQFATWIGGSILTALGSFQQLWLSKTEYEEYGGTLAIQKFP